MAYLQRPSTSCQMHRPSLTDDRNQINNNERKLSRSHTLDGIHLLRQQQQYHHQQQEQQRVVKLSPVLVDHHQQQQQRLGRSLLSNDNWKQETMVDVRVNAKAIEQSDQNILFGKGEK